MQVSQRKPGRPAKGADALTRQIMARATAAQHVAYLAAGGADWLRRQLDAEIIRQRTQPEPTAHQPFPAFTVADAKTGAPVPHSVIIMEF